MKPITKFEIISHGVDHAQYFQGCGLSFTDYTDIATGCGRTEKEALDDALDSLAQNGWDIEPIDQSDEYVNANDEMTPELAEAYQDEAHDNCELYYYVSVRVA
jgi:hypothetical protein